MKKQFPRVATLLTISLMLSACGKGMHMTLPPDSNQTTQNNTARDLVSKAKDGSSILLGSTDPADTLGNPDDVYLNSTTGDLFKKGTGEPAWKKEGNLRGADGATGATGATGANGADGTSFDISKNFNSGNGAPSAALNLNGFYLDISTGDLYAVKTGESSKLIMNLKGPVGENGKDGTNGIDGKNGATGATGANGANGTNGTKGETQQILNGVGAPAKELGTLNDIYIDSTSGDLYRKSGANEWTLLISLKGAPGKDGINGTNGIDGKNGSDGKNGTNGTNGIDGKDGKDGKDGTTITTVVNVPAPPCILLSLEDAQLNFAFNSAVVNDVGFVKLTKTAKALEVYASSIKEIEIKGETDRVGTAAYNKKLAQARADAVAKILISGGLSPRIVSAFGLDMPLKSSCTIDNCAADRWVHVSIQLADTLKLEDRNAIISALNGEFETIWK